MKSVFLLGSLEQERNHDPAEIGFPPGLQCLGCDAFIGRIGNIHTSIFRLGICFLGIFQARQVVRGLLLRR
jgi:hypothetical protein